jgi:hypothetical protein
VVQRAPQSLELLCLPSGRFKAPGMIVMLFSHPVPSVAQNKGSVPDVTGVLHSDRGRGGVANEMRRDPATKFLPSVVENLSLKRFRREPMPISETQRASNPRSIGAFAVRLGARAPLVAPPTHSPRRRMGRWTSPYEAAFPSALVARLERYLGPGAPVHHRVARPLGSGQGETVGTGS